jgi:hypothetical protein
MGIYHNREELEIHAERIREIRKNELKYNLRLLNPLVIICDLGKGLLMEDPALLHLARLIMIILFPIPYLINIMAILSVLNKKRRDRRDYKRISAEMENGTYEWAVRRGGVNSSSPKYLTVWLEEGDSYGIEDGVLGRKFISNVKADVVMEEGETYHIVFPDGTFVDAMIKRCKYRETGEIETRYIYDEIAIRDINYKKKF